MLVDKGPSVTPRSEKGHHSTPDPPVETIFQNLLLLFIKKQSSTVCEDYLLCQVVAILISLPMPWGTVVSTLACTRVFQTMNFCFSDTG